MIVVPGFGTLGIVIAMMMIASGPSLPWIHLSGNLLGWSFTVLIAWALFRRWAERPRVNADRLNRRAHQLLSEHYQIHGSIPPEE